MSKVIHFYETGPADVQRIEDIAVPPPAAGELRIRVSAIGLNRSDLIFRSGHHPMQPPVPSGNGAEAAGVVESVGAGVDDFATGDAVVVIPHMNPQRGTYGELINIAADRVMKAAATFNAQQNAAFWASYLTAYGGLIQQGKLADGDYVVIPAASSSVGLAAIQIANAVGAHPIALTRDASKMARLRAAGAEHVLLSGSSDLTSQIRQCTGGAGARVVFDPVGGPGTIALADAMALRGIYVLYGVLSGDMTPFPVGAAFEYLLTMTIYRLDCINYPQDFAKAKRFLDDGIARGVLIPTIDTIFSFDDVVAAHRYMENNQQFGKILLAVD
jgi:NADPH:quinone reductase-like Zn-dependent oxidoreductase